MGKNWDKGVPGVEFWKEALRVAKPGATLLAFGGTRTFHRLTCAIEDAGWEIRDCVMWLYGSGFPKSTDISKQLDKRAGAEREVVGDNPNRKGRKPESYSDGWSRPWQQDETALAHKLTIPATPLAQQWDGWGTALKPAYEPVLVFQKPLTDVPFDDKIIAETNHLIGGLLCQLLSSANNAEAISRLSPSVSEGVSVSALMIAAALHGNASGELFDATDMCSSQETVSTCLSIAQSWNGILGAICTSGNTFTTSTASSLTTALRTLNCLLSEIIPDTIMRVASLPPGSLSSATTAEKSLNGDGENTNNTRKRFATALASLPQDESSTDAKSAETSLLPTIRAAASVLNHALQPLITESGERLTPNYEPIIVAQKPLDGTYAQNAAQWGVAGLWIDGGRVGAHEYNQEQWSQKGASRTTGTTYGKHKASDTPLPTGRFPANLILDEEAGAILDEQSGETASQKSKRKSAGQSVGNKITLNTYKMNSDNVGGYDDKGGASRFFYTAKASRSERNAGLEDTLRVDYEVPTIGEYSCHDVNTVLVQLLQRATSESMATWHTVENGKSIMGLCQKDCLSTISTEINKITELTISHSLIHSLTSESIADANYATANGGNPVASAEYQNKLTPITINGKAALVLGAKSVASEVLSRISNAENWKPLTNIHTTVKPLSLMRYLARLTKTPTGGTVLDMFMGSGSTGVACLLEGRSFVGIEKDTEHGYFEIAQNRLASALQEIEAEATKPRTMEMFA